MTTFKNTLRLILLAILMTACGESKPDPTLGAALGATPVPTPRTGVTKAELNYPLARWLSDKDIWPMGRPAEFQNNLFGAFVTNDSQQEVLEFYQKKLVSLGLGYEPNYKCLESKQCQEIYDLEADIIECTPDHKSCGSTYQVEFLLVSATASPKDDQNGYIPETVYGLAKRGQTLVIFRDTPYRPFQPPAAITTSAALITTPVPKR